MLPDASGLASAYAQLSEPDLLRLGRAYDSLTDPAQSALRGEFERRGLEPPEPDEPEPQPEARNLVTVRRYRDLSEAIVGRSLLESSGIYVYLRDENTVRIDWQISNFIGGMRLEVEAADAELATQILSEPPPEIIAYEGPFDSSQPEFAQPHCPRCDAIDITFEGPSRGAAMAAVFTLGIPLPTGASSWLCHQCGTRWQDTGD